MCRANKNEKVNERLLQKMSEQAPGELLVEKYLVEIAKSHNVPFKPNPELAVRDPDFFYSSIKYDDAKRFDDNNTKNDGKPNGGNNSGAGGGGNNNGGGGSGGPGATVN